MRWLTVALVFGGVGCVEYDIHGGTEEGWSDGPRSRPPEERSHVDRIKQVVVPEVDVLWVVDNSCSMWEEQSALAANFPVFMQYFASSSLDYHIGVVSTDTYDPAHSGRLRQAGGHRYLKPDTLTPGQLFSSMAMMGTMGHWDERGFQAVQLALDAHGNGYNTGFFRDEAALHVIVISDENDHSPITTGEFVGWLKGRKAGRRTTFSSVVGPQGGCMDAPEVGLRYLQATRDIGGVDWSICTEDWSGLLDELGLQATGLKQEYFLSRLPVVDTIAVHSVDQGIVRAFEGEVDWVYDAARNSILFLEYVPEAGAEIVIEYEVVEAGTPWAGG